MIRSVLTAAALLAASPAFAGELTWHLYRDEDGKAAFLTVIDEDDIESPEPHFIVAFGCSPDRDWALFVTDVNPKPLGETIARNEVPTFTFILGGQPSGDFYPDIGFSQMDGVWQYSTNWGLSVVEMLAGAPPNIVVRGVGVEHTLPERGRDQLASFRDFCATVQPE